MGFEVGDLVWAKMKGFPPWPAQVTEPMSSLNVPKNKKNHQFVLFFGTNDCAWIADENIMLHSENILDTLSKKKSKGYQHAIDELLKHLGTKAEEKQSPSRMKKKVESGKKPTKVVKIIQSGPKKLERNVLGHKSPIKQVTKKRGIDDDNTKSNVKSPSKYSKLGVLDNFKRGKASDKHTDNSKHYVERVDSFENLPGCSSDQNKYLSDDKHADFSDNIDFESKDSEMKFDKKYGFIGLDEFGKFILTKFIERGMDVTLWYDFSQCKEFTKMNNIKLADSPAQLIIDCDIVFCCHETDSEAFTDIIHGEEGIKKGFEEAEKLKRRCKGFVGLNSIDFEMSKEINEAITIKNGYYLVAPIICTNDEELIVLASGNRELYTSCENCFHVIANKVIFLSCEIGASSKLSVMLSTVAGTVLSAMNESMVLADRLDLKKKDVHRIFKSVFFGNTLEKKVRKMSDHDYRRMTPLKHVQNDVNFALLLADKLSQTLPVTSAANEVLKHARLLKYTDSDISSIHKVVKLF